MHALVLLTLFSSMVAEGAAAVPGAPALLKFVPEMLAVVLTLCVLFEGIRSGFDVTAKYWIALGAMAFIITCGLITNSVGAGPVVAGLRYYLRWVPLFLAPAVFRFNEQQIRQQLLALVALGLAQIPIAGYQRWVVWSAERFSGDDVRGTVNDSGVLSIILICMVLVLTGYFMHKRIKKLPYLTLFFLLLLPTTINETKATVLLLPAGLLTAIVIAAPRGRRLGILLGSAGLMVVFLAILIPVYDKMNENNPYKNERSIVDFFTDQNRMATYMENKQAVALGTKRDVRRGDAIAVPLQYLARDPIYLAFGLGMGNVSRSSMGEQFTGNYYSLFQRFVITDFSVFLLELGVLGTGLVFVLYWLIFSDTLAVARLDTGMTGAFAAGWVGVVVVVTAGTFYSVMHTYASISYLFWYGSGIIAARRAQLLYSSQSSRTSDLRMQRSRVA